MSRCSCDSLMLLGDGVIISYYAKTLGLRDVFGDITVSLMELKKCHTVPKIMEILADQAERTHRTAGSGKHDRWSRTDHSPAQKRRRGSQLKNYLLNKSFMLSINLSLCYIKC
jgi:hypothetical protein